MAVAVQGVRDHDVRGCRGDLEGPSRSRKIVTRFFTSETLAAIPLLLRRNCSMVSKARESIRKEAPSTAAQQSLRESIEKKAEPRWAQLSGNPPTITCSHQELLDAVPPRSLLVVSACTSERSIAPITICCTLDGPEAEVVVQICTRRAP